METLCSLLQSATTFADVGCDHGYASEFMLKNGLCQKAYLSDISYPSLQKATTLLQDYVQSGKAVPVCGDGFFGIPKNTEEVLIAGMGGREIINILSDKKYGFLPSVFLFQPMKDGAALREYVVENGGYIERDFTFFAEGKYYDVLFGRKRKTGEKKQEYTQDELLFGKENLRTPSSDFLRLLDKKISETEEYLSRKVSEKSELALREKLEKLRKVRENATL